MRLEEGFNLWVKCFRSLSGFTDRPIEEDFLAAPDIAHEGGTRLGRIFVVRKIGRNGLCPDNPRRVLANRLEDGPIGAASAEESQPIDRLSLQRGKRCLF